MQATDSVTEPQLRAALSQRSGISEADLLTPIMLMQHDRRLRWPLPAAMAEEVITAVMDRMRAVLPVPTASLKAERAGRYVFLSEFTAAYQDYVTRRIVDRVRFAGVAQVRPSFAVVYDPDSEAGWGARPPSTALGQPKPDWGWWQQVRAAGARPIFRMPDPWCGAGEPPVDRALCEREASGNLEAYRRALHAALQADPRHTDCWAHLGSEALGRAESDPAALTEALAFYQAGVTIAELALGEMFTGVLAWAELDNRPFHRALHGLGLTLWRLGQWDAAAAVFGNCLWLDPADSQGVRYLVGPVRRKTAWERCADVSV